MKIQNLALAGIGVAFIASAGFAQETKTYESELFPRDISDTLGPTTLSIDVADAGAIVSIKSVELLGLFHTWAGDLDITLTAPGGASVPLLTRPGVPASTFGDSADFAGDYSWTSDGMIYDADLFGSVVPAPGPYAPTDGLGFGQLVDEEKQGLWTLTITDNAGGNDGTINGFRITMNNIPAPGALALLGMAGLVGRRRRR